MSQLFVGLLAYIMLAQILSNVPLIKPYAKIILAMFFLIALHGFNMVKLLSLAALFYSLSFLRQKYTVVCTWILAVGTIFGTELYSLPFEIALWQGLYPRWQVLYKFVLLRMISFNLDYVNRHQSGLFQRHREKCPKHCATGNLCHKGQSLKGQEAKSFTCLHYLEYLYYPPLLIAGPIISFNSFVAQKNLKSRVPFKVIFLYGMRWLACLGVLEGLLRLFFVVAIKDAKAFLGFSPIQLFAVAYFNLKVIWLKLMIIWRFFRWFALVDGVVSPENMLRCMSNNHSLLGFWRAWHHSFNLWVTRYKEQSKVIKPLHSLFLITHRYLYIPLGGSRWAFLNIWPVFAFVAIWHDINPALLSWAILVPLAIIPELVCTGWLMPSLTKLLPNAFFLRHVAALGATLNIAMLMTANLVGFAVGVDGTKQLLAGLAARGPWAAVGFFLWLLVTFYAAAQLQLEWRAEERRRGLHLNY